MNGIRSLNAGAYANLPQQDIRLSGDHRPTYTQRRRDQMAGGGIMGSNAGSMLVAPTADGSRPGYAFSWNPMDWIEPIKKFVAPVTDIAKKVGQTIIPGGETGYFDLYGGQPTLPTGMPQGSPGQINPVIDDLIYGMPQGSPGQLNPYEIAKNVVTGMPQGSPGQLNPYDSEASLQRIMDTAADTFGNGGQDGVWTPGAGAPQASGDPYTLDMDPRNIFEKGMGALKTGASSVMDFLGPKDPYPIGKDGKLYYPPNIAGPIAGGMAAGAIQAAMPKDVMPQDTSGIDIADIRRRALTGSDPGLHFLPKGEATTAYAQGGRTGYYAGDRVQQNMITAFSTYKNAGGREDFNGWFSDIYLPEAAGRQTKMGEPMDIEGWREDEPMDIEGWRGMAAQGGRIGAQEGGLMNLGGMEKDYRQEGGFVPLGGEEKADDVPARLSKNEFVFTADAVRSAGGGDIDAGAEVMEKVMNNLEQGGQISEESQGLEGARDMFATAQRLEGVL